MGEFRERARHYAPSTLARGYFKSIDSPLQNLGDSGPVDLLNWIREVLGRGPDRRYGTIILTGGSSSWSFMVPMVREVFGDAEILIPANPECTIGEGLALWHVLHQRYATQKDKALANISALEDELTEVVAAATRRAGDDISEEIAGHIMAVARPRFHQWWERGGRLGDVEREVADRCKQIPVNPIIKARLGRILPEVESAGGDAMRNWLLRQGVKLGEWRGLPLSGAIGTRDLSLTVRIGDDLANTAVEKAVGLVTVAIIGGLVAVIAATSVTISASPLAVLVLPVIGGLYLARDYIKEKLLAFEFSGDALEWLQKLYGKAKLNEALNKGDEECRDAVRSVTQKALEDVRQQLDSLVSSARDEVLRRYGLLDKLSSLPKRSG